MHKKKILTSKKSSLVVKVTTLCVLFSLTTVLNFEVCQMDVRNLFFHGDIDEEVYMKQLQGFVVLNKEHLVCKQKHSWYGLKLAPRQWYKKFDTFMLSHGFSHSHVNHYLYTKKDINGSPIILIYVDKKTTFDTLKDQRKLIISKRDLGNPKHILVMRINRDRRTNCYFYHKKIYIKGHVALHILNITKRISQRTS